MPLRLLLILICLLSHPLSAARLIGSTTLDIGKVWTIAFNHAGTEIVAGGDDGVVAVYDARTLALKQRHQHGRGFHIYSARFLPDNRRVISTSFGGTVEIWDKRDGSLLKTLDGHSEYASRVEVSDDGRYIATAGADDVVIIWDGETYEPLYHLRAKSPVGLSFLDPQGAKLAVAAMDGLKIWDVATESATRVIDRTYNFVSLSTDPKRQILLATTMPRDQYRSRVINLKTLGEVFLDGAFHFYWSTAVSPSARFLAASDFRGQVNIWESSTGHTQDTIGGDDFQTMSVAFRPRRSNLLYVGGTRGEIKVYLLTLH